MDATAFWTDLNQRIYKNLLTNADYCDSIYYSNSLEASNMQKLFDSELKVMELIWANEPISAKELSILADKEFGWNKNTTYTVIKKIEAKGYIKRTDPGFICISIVSKKDVCESETQTLVDKLFGGSRKALFSALLEDEKLTKDEIDELRKLIDKR
jgi:predicted transcriptional regulator